MDLMSRTRTLLYTGPCRYENPSSKVKINASEMFGKDQGRAMKYRPVVAEVGRKWSMRALP